MFIILLFINKLQAHTLAMRNVCAKIRCKGTKKIAHTQTRVRFSIGFCERDFLRKSLDATCKIKNPKHTFKQAYVPLGFFLSVPRAGLEPAQPSLAKGF